MLRACRFSLRRRTRPVSPGKHFTLYGQTMDALEDTAEEGDVGEDDSQEYALTYDPTLRGKQLAMPEYGWPQTSHRACASSL